jgi:hypothetical protein
MSIDHLGPSTWDLSKSSVPAIGSAFYSAVPLIAVILVQMAVGIWIYLSYPTETVGYESFSYEKLVFLVIYVPMSMILICLYRMVRFTRPASPIRALAAQTRDYVLDRQRLCNGSIIIALVIPLMTTFGYIKTSLPVVAPFAWDITLSDWDQAIFFGYLPYELLQPVVGYHVITKLLDFAYKLWFVLMWMSLVAFAFTRTTSALRTRYLLSFFLTWFVLGSVLALAFSSAGPCFYALLEIGPDPYAPLMSYLRDADRVFPVSALEMQNVLWYGYLGKVEALGISAAPSLHNATSLLMALAAWKVDRKLGLIVSAFAAVIFVGSISLGWHYAVDGLIAFAVTPLIWIASGRIADLWETPALRT